MLLTRLLEDLYLTQNSVTNKYGLATSYEVVVDDVFDRIHKISDEFFVFERFGIAFLAIVIKTDVYSINVCSKIYLDKYELLNKVKEMLLYTPHDEVAKYFFEERFNYDLFVVDDLEIKPITDQNKIFLIKDFLKETHPNAFLFFAVVFSLPTLSDEEILRIRKSYVLENPNKIHMFFRDDVMEVLNTEFELESDKMYYKGRKRIDIEDHILKGNYPHDDYLFVDTTDKPILKSLWHDLPYARIDGLDLDDKSFGITKIRKTGIYHNLTTPFYYIQYLDHFKYLTSFISYLNVEMNRNILFLDANDHSTTSDLFERFRKALLT